MRRSVRCFLRPLRLVYTVPLVFVAIALEIASTARADGLIFQLPPDGAWTLYTFQQIAEVTLPLKSSEDARVADSNRPTTAVGMGFLVLRSVGEESIDDKACRWIELEHCVTLAGATARGGEASSLERTIILKLLVPVDRLKCGEDPLSHVMQLFFKDGDRPVEEIVDDKRRQYELDRFRPVFPRPGKHSRPSPIEAFSASSLQEPELACVRLEFHSDYSGKLGAGRKGNWTYAGRHKVWLNDSIPFGVAGLEFVSTSKESYADGGANAVQIKSVERLVVAAYGTGAKGRILP